MGDKIRTCLDPWLPKPVMSEAASKGHVEEVLVTDLFKDSRCAWDVRKLEQLFVRPDGDVISNIPLSLYKGDCHLAWHYD
ncbi:hypothetical protein ACOSQ2_018988 [Xanthoceras sorbifolium]